MKRSLALVILFLVVGLCAMPVLANSAPPPNEVWLTFEGRTASGAAPQALQLLACATSACETPGYVFTYGNCSDPACRSMAPPERYAGQLDCVANRCLLTTRAIEVSYFSLIAQFEDGVRTTPPVAGFPSGYGTTAAWRVVLTQDEAMTMTTDATFTPPERRYAGWFRALLFTLAVEAVVAGLWVVLRQVNQRVEVKHLLTTMGVVLIANLASYPLVWLWLPSLSRFQPAGIRRVGAVISVLALGYAVWLLAILAAEGRRRLRHIVFLIVSLPLVGAGVLFWVFVSFYGYPDIAIPGPPWLAMIAIAEVVAVVLEAGLLYLGSTYLHRRQLLGRRITWLQAGVLSLMINAASFLLGRLVIPA